MRILKIIVICLLLINPIFAQPYKGYRGKEINSYYFLQKRKKRIIVNPLGEKVFEFNKNQHFFTITKTGKLLYRDGEEKHNDGGGIIKTGIQKSHIYDLEKGIDKTINYTLLYSYDPHKCDIYTIHDSLGNYGFIDSNGEILLPAQYKKIEPIYDHGMYAVFTDSTFFLTNRNGKNFLEKEFKTAPAIKNNHFIFPQKNCIKFSADGINVGLYNYKTEKEIIPCIYSDIGYLKDYNIVYKDNIAELLDIENNKILLPKSIGANFISSIIDSFDGNLLISYHKNNKYNIYYNGEILFDENYDIKSIDYSARIPFITGRLNQDNSYFVYDFNVRKMLIYGLPYIKHNANVEYLDDSKEYVKIEASISPEKKGYEGPSYTMLVNNKGECLIPFYLQPEYKIFHMRNKKIYMASVYGVNGLDKVSFYFNCNDTIATDILVNSIDRDIHLYRNQIIIEIRHNTPFHIKGYGDVWGGRLIIEENGNVIYLK